MSRVIASLIAFVLAIGLAMATFGMVRAEGPPNTPPVAITPELVERGPFGRKGPNDDGCVIEGTLVLRPDEMSRGVSVSLNPDCSIKSVTWFGDRAQAQNGATVDVAPARNDVRTLATAACTGHTIVEDPVAIDVTNLSNSIEWTYDYFVVNSVLRQNVLADPFETSGWYIASGPTQQSSWGAGSKYYTLRSWATFENYTWGDDALKTWASHDNATNGWSDGNCTLNYSISLGGEDSNLLSGQGFIHRAFD